jgi:hypothetical protein
LAACAATGASKVPMTKQVAASLVFMVWLFSREVESMNDVAILKTYPFAGAHRARQKRMLRACHCESIGHNPSIHYLYAVELIDCFV